MKKKQPALLEKELNRLYLLSDAILLDASVLNNSITLEEIVEEVNALRKKDIRDHKTVFDTNIWISY